MSMTRKMLDAGIVVLVIAAIFALAFSMQSATENSADMNRQKKTIIAAAKAEFSRHQHSESAKGQQPAKGVFLTYPIGRYMGTQ